LPVEKKSEEMKVEICKVLDRIGALKFGAFKLTSGKMSPYYIDLRIVPSFPDSFQKICESYVKFIKTEIGTDNIDRIAGIPVSGIAFASVVAFNLRKPFLYARRGERHHGRERSRPETVCYCLMILSQQGCRCRRRRKQLLLKAVW
jgi:orotate phosphoribosyltransferase